MTGQDTGANPRVHIWANGVDPAAELHRMLDVRRVALDRFGENAVRNGTPLALLEETLVPLFLHHRYQIDAAASALGGLDYIYAIRGDGRDPVRPIGGDAQRAALDALMRTLAPGELTVPRAAIDLIPPRPAGFGRHRELFPRYTGGMFDRITPALVLADLTMAQLLDPTRAARLVEQHALDATTPDLVDVLETLIDATFPRPPADPYEAEVARAVQHVVVGRMVRLASAAPMAQVRAVAAYWLGELDQRLAATPASATRDGVAGVAHADALRRSIARLFDHPAEPGDRWAPPSAPPGSPIGDAGFRWTPEPYCSVDAGWSDW